MSAELKPACEGLDDDTMFPSSDSEHYAADVDFAKSICAACPDLIRRKCLVWALAQKEPAGVWGGYSTEERTDLLRGLSEEVERRKRGHAPKKIDDEAAARMHADGQSKHDIARHFGTSTRTVERALERTREVVAA